MNYTEATDTGFNANVLYLNSQANCFFFYLLKRLLVDIQKLTAIKHVTRDKKLIQNSNGHCSELGLFL